MTIYLSNLQFTLYRFCYRWLFDDDLEGMVTYESHDGYCNVSFNADNGRTNPGCVYADTYPSPGSPLKRYAGVKYTPTVPIWIQEGDVLQGWAYNITETQSGAGVTTNGLEVQIHYVGGASRKTWEDVDEGTWNDVVLTVPVDDVGEAVDYIIVAMYSNSESTAEFYIDEIYFMSPSNIGVCNTYLGSESGDPIYHSNVRTG